MTAPPRPPGRPRSAQLDADLFASALAIVAEGGYARLTIDGVAARSGVSKASIYRRFRSRADLAAEALLNAYPIAPAATEAAPGAVQRHLERIFAAAGGPAAEALRGLMADAQLDAAFHETFRQRFIVSRREALAAAIRLEHGSHVRELELALDLVFGPMWYRLLVGHAPLDGDLATRLEALTRQVLLG